MHRCFFFLVNARHISELQSKLSAGKFCFLSFACEIYWKHFLFLEINNVSAHAYVTKQNNRTKCRERFTANIEHARINSIKYHMRKHNLQINIIKFI